MGNIKNLVDRNIIYTLLDNEDTITKFFQRKRTYGTLEFYSFVDENVLYYHIKDNGYISHKYDKSAFMDEFIKLRLPISDKKSCNDKIANIIYDYIIKYKSLNKIIT